MASAFNVIPDRTFLGCDGNQPNTGLNNDDKIAPERSSNSDMVGLISYESKES
jgi:hypothetical protein